MKNNYRTKHIFLIGLIISLLAPVFAYAGGGPRPRPKKVHTPKVARAKKVARRPKTSVPRHNTPVTPATARPESLAQHGNMPAPGQGELLRSPEFSRLMAADVLRVKIQDVVVTRQAAAERGVKLTAPGTPAARADFARELTNLSEETFEQRRQLAVAEYGAEVVAFNQTLYEDVLAFVEEHGRWMSEADEGYELVLPCMLSFKADPYIRALIELQQQTPSYMDLMTITPATNAQWYEQLDAFVQENGRWPSSIRFGERVAEKTLHHACAMRMEKFPQDPYVQKMAELKNKFYHSSTLQVSDEEPFDATSISVNTRSNEPPPIWAMYGGASEEGVRVTGRRQSTASLRLELSEEGVLPLNWQEYSHDELQEFLDTYRALKSSGERDSRFRKRLADGTLEEKRSEAELYAWAHNQPDWKGGRNFIFKPYNRPFNEKVKSLRILVVNDHHAPLEPLIEMAAENSQAHIEVHWKSSLVGLGENLPQTFNDYDVILTDYCLQDGSTAVDLGMKAYEGGVKPPVVFYAGTGATPEWLLQFNLTGRIDIAKTRDAARRVLNYLSDLVMDEVEPEASNK